MIPDKIYITEYNANVQTGYFSRNQDDVFTEEYIRKDALIEWANSWLAFKRSGVVLDDGFSYAMEELIKKLNSM